MVGGQGRGCWQMRAVGGRERAGRGMARDAEDGWVGEAGQNSGGWGLGKGQGVGASQNSQNINMDPYLSIVNVRSDLPPTESVGGKSVLYV